MNSVRRQVGQFPCDMLKYFQILAQEYLKQFISVGTYRSADQSPVLCYMFGSAIITLSVNTLAERPQNGCVTRDGRHRRPPHA